MRSIWTIAWREIRAFFVSPMAYIVLTVWLFMTGLQYYILAVYFSQATSVAERSADHNPINAFFGGTSLFYYPLLIFVPVMTMRLIAEERRSGTLEALMTAPVSEISIVLGKYLASLVFWIALWVPTLMYVWITSAYGDVDMGTMAACYLGIFLIGLYYLAIGLLMSAVAPNQIIAAVLTFMALFALFLLGILEFVFQEEGPKAFLSYLSIWGHMENFSKGVVDSRPLVFDLSLAAFSIVLAIILLRARRLRSANEMLMSVAGLVVLFAILGMVNYLGFRNYTRWDWTTEGLYTLSSRTQAVLRDVNREVKLYVFMGEGEPGFGELKELIERYRAEQNRIVVRYVDPDREPAEYQVLAQRFELAAAMTEGGGVMSEVAAVVVAGDRRWKIDRSDLMEIDFGSIEDEGGPQFDVKTEQAITGAIVQVLRGRATKICVTRGHGEWTLEPGERTLQMLKDELARDNVEMEGIDTLGQQRIDRGCDAVFVIGPVTPFNEAEGRLLETYVRAGGNLLVTVDPIIDRDAVQPTGLEDPLRRLGIIVGNDVVLELDEARLATPSPLEMFFVNDWGDGEHPAVRVLAAVRARVVLSLARSIRPEEGSTAQTVMRASEESFAATDLAGLGEGARLEPGEGDQRGPISIAVATRIRTEPAANEDEGPHEDDGHGHDEDEAGGDRPGGRVIVAGDSEWLTPELLGQPSVANFDLASNFTGWLAERQALISIAPKRVDAQAIMMTEEDLQGVFWRVIALLPLSMILLGFAVWWLRRS